MVTLQEEQLEMIKQYVELTGVMEEAFTYVLESFHNLERTEGDRVLADIMNGLTQIASSNVQLNQWFEKDTDLQNVLTTFGGVVEKAALLFDHPTDPTLKQKIVEDELYPVFKEWVSSVEQMFISYIQS